VARESWHVVGAPEPVPVREEWGKVSVRPLVVSIMLGRTTPQAKGHQVVNGPREVIAAVVLGGNVDVEDHEAPCCEAMAPEQDGVYCSPKPQVPQVILEVKDQRAAQDAQEEAPESGCLTGQRAGRPPQPLCHCSGKDVKQMVVHGDSQRIPDLGPGDGSVRVEPVAVDAGPGGSQQVKKSVMTNHQEVGGDGEYHGAERASQEVMVVLVEVVPDGLQDQALGLAPGSCKSSHPSSRMPSQLEGAMSALITVFYNYSGHDGDKYKLNKGELKELLNAELTDFLMSQKDPMLVEKIMKDLDSNKDNEVDFNEFVVLVAALTVACNDFFQEQQKKAK
ncbi:hypothetical protein FQN60_008103, partial [Etheostoma spectabile]